MQNGEEKRQSGLAWRDGVSVRQRSHSIAKRLFFSAALLSFAILLAAGLVLSTIYRRTAVANFDERLSVYLHELVADIATPGEDSRTAPGQLGEPQFEIPLSGWYSRAWICRSPRLEVRARCLRQSFHGYPILAWRLVPGVPAEALRKGRRPDSANGRTHHRCRRSGHLSRSSCRDDGGNRCANLPFRI